MFVALPDDLREAVDAAGARVGAYARIAFAEEVDSTNDVALSLLAAGASPFAAVLASAQRKGRGRRGHSWHSPPGGGLYLSVIVPLSAREAHASLVTLAAGVALATAVWDVTALPVELKWPNDLVIGRPWRKLGGILTEAGPQGAVPAVVVGVGLNVTRVVRPETLAARATSIEEELGHDVPRAGVLVSLLEGLWRMMQLCRNGESARIIAEWDHFGGRAVHGGAIVSWGTDEAGRGRTAGLDVDGALLVDVAGRRERIIAGDVSWEVLPRD